MDETIVWPSGPRKGGFFANLRLARKLREGRFELAVLFANSFRSAWVTAWAGITRRIGFARDGRSLLLTDRLAVEREDGKIVPHPICRDYGRIAAALGCPIPSDDLQLYFTSDSEMAVERRLAGMGLAAAGQDGPLVVISPGASYGASKLWLAERFAEVGKRLIGSMGATVMVTCGPGEEAIARRIGETLGAGGYTLDDPRLTLAELKSLIRRADLLIGNDAGPRHIAKAFGRPVVTIFGPTHQAWTDTSYAPERKISIPVDCGPCQKKTCPLGHHQCMTGISVDMVYDACVGLLAVHRTNKAAEPCDAWNSRRVCK